MGLGGGLEEEEGVFNLQDAACTGAPEPQHLQCFTQGLISRIAFSLMLRESSTSGPSQLMSLLLLMWLLLVFYRVSGGRSSGAAQGGGR